jgi:hypothetical protein
MDTDSALAAHAALVDALRDPGAYPHATGPVEVIETHISSVLLAGDFAYKLKKPVDLGFADFSTLVRRRTCCEEEVRLNRRTAPAIYLDVTPVTSGADGKPLFGGTGQVLDYAVRMKRFPAEARLDRVARAGRLDAALVDRLADAIAAMHAQAQPVPEASEMGSAREIARWTAENLAELRHLAVVDPPKRRFARLAEWTRTEYARREATFAARRADGFVRECHGDLHLGNVVVLDGEPVPFDCIEFNPQLRFIDVMSDVAFAWMDLLDHDLPRHAARLLTAYVEATGDYPGLAVLRFYAVYRALVRAKVALIRRAQPDLPAEGRARADADCLRYVAAAERIVDAPEPRLVLTCGVTGSGKTTVAQHLLERLGAVRARSDLERKRRAGVAPGEHRPAAVGAGLYQPAATDATYDALAAATAAILDAGFPAIADATFARRAARDRFRALAARLGVPFAVVVCEASPQTLQARVVARAARGTDASDATPEVLAHQLATFEAIGEDERETTRRIDTEADPVTLAARCEALAGHLERDGATAAA